MVDEDLRFKREILGVASLLILGSLFVLFPFMDAIILAAATSYFLRFGHRKLNARLNNEALSTLIIVSSIIAFVALSIFFAIENFSLIETGIRDTSDQFQTEIDRALEPLNVGEDTADEIKSSFNLESLTDRLQSFLFSLPTLLIHVGIYLVTAIYLYKDGGRIKQKVFHIIDNLPEDEEKIIRTLIRSTDSIFKGVFLTQLTVALILGAITGLGFYAISLLTSSIPFIPFWSFLVAVAALMPLFAAFMIYGPIGFYYFLFGEPVKGVLILVFGTVVLNVLPEIFLRPYVGSRQMNEHPLIIFTGFIAGPLTLGVKGIILGPVLLILSKEFLLNYTELVSDAEK